LGKDQTKKRNNIVEVAERRSMVGVVEMKRTPRMMFL
jgi:hypothetical protein